MGRLMGFLRFVSICLGDEDLKGESSGFCECMPKRISGDVLALLIT
jgi:hypothetical protein